MAGCDKTTCMLYAHNVGNEQARGRCLVITNDIIDKKHDEKNAKNTTVNRVFLVV